MTAVSLSDDHVPSEIVSSIFYSASVSDSLALLVAETSGRTQRFTWANEGAVQLLGYGLEDLRAMPVEQLFPSLGGGNSSSCCAASGLPDGFSRCAPPAGRWWRPASSRRRPRGAAAGP